MVQNQKTVSLICQKGNFAKSKLSKLAKNCLQIATKKECPTTKQEKVCQKIYRLGLITT